ncbi:MAG: glycosyltransferase family 4 protein [Chloroflexia bacterium]|nr:glycosyltransferase family 4 protein [Chloroflexia bacterium]
MPITDLAVDASRMITGQRTGTEHYSVEIIRALASIDTRPPVTLYTRADYPTTRVVGTLTKSFGPRRLWTHIGLSRAMYEDKPDALFVPSHVVPLVHPRATVATVHDLGYLGDPESHPRRQRMMLNGTTQWNVRAARRIIAISAKTRDDLVNHYDVNVDKIRVIHHGVDHARFKPLPPDATAPVLAKHDITPPYLLFVSTVQPRKNLTRLIEAFESLDDRRLSLVIAGKSGWLSEPIERRIHDSPAASRMRRVGHVPDDDLPALYSAAEVFTFPSLYEGFGMGVIEAMACGTPVVTSNSSSLSEVAGDAAVLVKPTDVRSIAAGIHDACDPATRQRLRELGLDHAQNFTWERSAAQTLEVIEEAYRDSHEP